MTIASDSLSMRPPRRVDSFLFRATLRGRQPAVVALQYLTTIPYPRAMHTPITIISLHEMARTPRRDAHGTFGARVACDVVMRDVGYVTRLSAKRVEAGCATERLSVLRERARSTQTHGVHVAKRHWDAMDAWLAAGTSSA